MDLTRALQKVGVGATGHGAMNTPTYPSYGDPTQLHRNERRPILHAQLPDGSRRLIVPIAIYQETEIAEEWCVSGMGDHRTIFLLRDGRWVFLLPDRDVSTGKWPTISLEEGFAPGVLKGRGEPSDPIVD